MDWGALLALVCAVGICKGAVGGASLQPGGAAAVREAGTYNTRENQAQFSTFQSRLHSRLYWLCAGLCLWDKRCARLCGELLAAACHLVRYESHRPLFDRRLLGGTYERMDDSRNRRSEALHHRQKQAEKVAIRHGGHGSHSDGAGGNDDYFYSLREEPMKYKIEKNTVQETLILPLYSRKLCTELYPNLYRDETAVRLIDEIDYDFSEAEKNSRSLMQRFGALEVAMRQNDLAFEVQAYLKNHPCAAVVNLGCGLDNTGKACDNGRCKIYNLDFPDVIALRQQLLPAGEREQNIPCDLKDPAWFDKIDASGGAVFFASGVFYYFLTEQVREPVQGMADAFPGGVLVFDAANRTAVKMIAKTWLRTAKIKDVGAYFAVSDAKSELSPWGSRLQVSSRGYMMGYNDLKDPSVSGFFRFLAKVGDNGMKMQIVKIRFGGKL